MTKTIILFMVASFAHIWTTYYTHQRIKINKTHQHKPLYDIVHNNTHNCNKYSYIIDIMLILFMIPLFQSVKRGESIKMLSHFIRVFSVLIIMRSLVLIVTDLPSSDETCDSNNLNNYNMIFGHCNDKIFSGHTAFTLLAVLIAYTYGYISKFELFILIVLQLAYGFLLVVTRSHYTVDVLLTYYIVVPVYFLMNNLKL